MLKWRPQVWEEGIEEHRHVWGMPLLHTSWPIALGLLLLTQDADTPHFRNWERCGGSRSSLGRNGMLSGTPCSSSTSVLPPGRRTGVNQRRHWLGPGYKAFALCELSRLLFGFFQGSGDHQKHPFSGSQTQPYAVIIFLMLTSGYISLDVSQIYTSVISPALYCSINEAYTIF